MIGRRAAVGLSLVCSLLICAFAAQTAFGAAATNITAVECSAEAGVLDFSDAHCDNKNGEGFGHIPLENGKSIEVSITNEKTAESTAKSTPAIQKGTVFGVKTEITCTVVTGTGTLENTEKEKEHKLTGTVKAEFSKCTVNKPAGFGCKVKEPIVVTSKTEGVEGLGAEKNEMGLEFKPSEGEVFAEIVIEGCILKGTHKVTGTAIGTGTPAPTEEHTGTTNVFTNAMTKETLKLAGNAAEISSTTTVTTKSNSTPVALTTTT